MNNMNTRPLDNNVRSETHKKVITRKKYKSPSLTNIGLISQVTLAGGLVPAADSGNTFGPS